VNAFGADLETRIAHRLALGIEPRDFAREGRLHHPVRVDIEGSGPWTPGAPSDERRSYRRPMRRGDVRPSVSRHDTCRHVLLYHPALTDRVDLRIWDHSRRYAPRRLRIPLITLADVMNAEEAGAPLPPEPRIRRPTLFPGAAYDVGYVATGLRGRVVRDGQPMRWARVAASLPVAGAPVVGRAHGDDRGEFLLLLSSQAVSGAELPASLDVRVSIFGPQDIPTPNPTNLPTLDAWWDLPLEELPAAGDPDPVSPGDALPPTYVEGAQRMISFRYGHILSKLNEVDDFDFIPPP
jgi:hypothetical protein